MRPEAMMLIVPVVFIGAFWAFLIVHSLAKSRVRELEIRERIAMIEKGMVPPPEVDPRGFDRAMRRYDRTSGGSYRHRRAGVTLVGVGLGLMVMIAFAGEEPQKAIGIGGFIVLLGLAFVVNSMLEPTRSDGSLDSSRDRGEPTGPPAPTSDSSARP
jgi:Domain of unknown function (DUF6249)